MTEKTKDEYGRQERFNPDDVDDPEVWAGHARPPIVHDHVYLYLMKKSVELPDNYRLLAFYEDNVPALVMAIREERKLVDWTSKGFPDLNEDAARELVAIMAEGFGIPIEDVLFCEKIEVLRPPTLVN